MTIELTECGLSHVFLSHYEAYGTALKFEERYGDLPFTLTQEKTLDEVLGVKNQLRYLIMMDREPIGAMRLMEFDYTWYLSWVFISPAHRRKGIFTKIWNRLRRTHPRIMPLPPYSDAMVSFLNRPDAALSQSERASLRGVHRAD